jgi:thymidine kinase
MNLRMNDAGEAVTHGETVMIGGNERYEALCRKHFLERMGVHPHAS